MADFTVTISSAEKKALLNELVDVEGAQTWLDNAIHNKARQCMDAMIAEKTTERVDLLSFAEKEIIIDGLP